MENNLIDDLHHKTINFLTQNFKHIILPNFENIRNINRDLMQLKHYQFKERLRNKCLLRKYTLHMCTITKNSLIPWSYTGFRGHNVWR